MLKDFEKLLKIVYIVAIIYTIVSIVSSNPIRDSNSYDFNLPIKIDKYYIKTDKDKDFKEIKLPTKIKIDKPFTIIADISSLKDLQLKSFSITSSHFHYKVYIDNKEIFQKQIYSKYMRGGGGMTISVMDFPETVYEHKITIQYTPTLKYFNRYTIRPLFYGYRANFIVPVLFYNDILGILISFMLFLTFLISMILSVLLRKK